MASLSVVSMGAQRSKQRERFAVLGREIGQRGRDSMQFAVQGIDGGVAVGGVGGEL